MIDRSSFQEIPYVLQCVISRAIVLTIATALSIEHTRVIDRVLFLKGWSIDHPFRNIFGLSITLVFYRKSGSTENQTIDIISVVFLKGWSIDHPFRKLLSLWYRWFGFQWALNVVGHTNNTAILPERMIDRSSFQEVLILFFVWPTTFNAMRFRSPTNNLKKSSWKDDRSIILSGRHSAISWWSKTHSGLSH